LDPLLALQSSLGSIQGFYHPEFAKLIRGWEDHENPRVHEEVGIYLAFAKINESGPRIRKALNELPRPMVENKEPFSGHEGSGTSWDSKVSYWAIACGSLVFFFLLWRFTRNSQKAEN